MLILHRWKTLLFSFLLSLPLAFLLFFLLLPLLSFPLLIPLFVPMSVAMPVAVTVPVAVSVAVLAVTRARSSLAGPTPGAGSSFPLWPGLGPGSWGRPGSWAWPASWTPALLWSMWSTEDTSNIYPGIRSEMPPSSKHDSCRTSFFLLSKAEYKYKWILWTKIVMKLVVTSQLVGKCSGSTLLWYRLNV